METTGTYHVTSWNEKTWDGQLWDQVAGAKQTHSIVEQEFSGVIEGQALCHQLIAYTSDTCAYFVGYHHVTGRVAGRSGSFVLQSSGTYKDGFVDVQWSVVPDSGTDELTGLQGHGGYRAGHDDYPNVPYTFEYSFAKQANQA
jgi:hypothetical protein